MLFRSFNHGTGASVLGTSLGIDAIAEFQTLTNTYGAQFGGHGSVINAASKSGTNAFHGSAFEFLRNSALDTRNQFDKANEAPPFRRNQFGGTIGGPVKKDKAFFFFNYEQYLERSQIVQTDTVPAPEFLRGDFSSISPNGNCSRCAGLGIPLTPLGGSQLDPLGRPIFANTIYDPLTRAAATSGPLAGQGYANPFPGNIIPATRFDPTTVKFLNLLDTLGVKAQNSNLTGNYLGSIPSDRYSVIPSVKIDHSPTSKGKLSFYYQETNLENQVSVGAPQGADGLDRKSTRLNSSHT